MVELPHTHSCFVCGESNPIGMRLRFWKKDEEVITEFIPDPAHCGFRQTVHGGLISTLLDEIMAWACIAQAKKFAYCAELSVRFLVPLPPGVRTKAVARITANRRDRVYEVESELLGEDGIVYSKATGKYLPIKDQNIEELMGDLVGEMGAIVGG